MAPNASTLVSIGETVQFTATARSSDGSAIGGKTFNWTSSDQSVVSVNSAGLAAAVGNGVATVTAEADGHSGVADVTVAQTASRLGFTIQPSDAQAGTPVSPAVVVEVQDALGSAVSGRSDPVTVAIGTNPGSGVLAGTLTRNALNGAAGFDDLTIERAGTGYTLTATSGSLTGTTSAAFAISAAPASMLAFTVQPGRTQVGIPIVPAVEVEAQDPYENRVPSWTEVVTITIEDNPSAGQLNGTATVAPVGGVASFDDISIDAEGAGYSLRATSATLADATSSQFSVIAAGGFVSAGAGGEYSCAVLANGEAYCWGINFGGTLGNGSSSGNSAVPVKVLGGLTFSWIGAGVDRTCGLTMAGDAYCWGAGLVSSTPVLVAGGIEWKQLSLGSVHVCGVSTSGEGYCWGDNFGGRLGDGTSTSRTNPTPVAGGLTFASIDAGAGHTCGITTGGDAYCWGSNSFGALGIGTFGGGSMVPVAVSGGLSFEVISAGNALTCGITAIGSAGGDGLAYCWGSNFRGNLGIGNTNVRLVPTLVAGPTGATWTAVSAGAGEHACGVISTGDLYCWGPNPDGRLGDGTTDDRQVPTLVQGNLEFVAVSAGDRQNTGSPGLSHTCGLTVLGALYCWGSNTKGQIGDGTLTDRTVPVSVTQP